MEWQLRALLAIDSGFDDTRFEKLLDRLSRHCAPEHHEQFITAGFFETLRRGLSHSDTRVRSVCVRLVGLFGSSSAGIARLPSDLLNIPFTLCDHDDYIVSTAALEALQRILSRSDCWSNVSEQLLSQWCESLRSDSKHVSDGCVKLLALAAVHATPRFVHAIAQLQLDNATVLLSALDLCIELTKAQPLVLQQTQLSHAALTHAVVSLDPLVRARLCDFVHCLVSTARYELLLVDAAHDSCAECVAFLCDVARSMLLSQNKAIVLASVSLFGSLQFKDKHHTDLLLQHARGLLQISLHALGDVEQNQLSLGDQSTWMIARSVPQQWCYSVLNALNRLLSHYGKQLLDDESAAMASKLCWKQLANDAPGMPVRRTHVPEKNALAALDVLCTLPLALRRRESLYELVQLHTPAVTSAILVQLADSDSLHSALIALLKSPIADAVYAATRFAASCAEKWIDVDEISAVLCANLRHNDVQVIAATYQLLTSISPLHCKLADSLPPNELFWVLFPSNDSNWPDLSAARHAAVELLSAKLQEEPSSVLGRVCLHGELTSALQSMFEETDWEAKIHLINICETLALHNKTALHSPLLDSLQQALYDPDRPVRMQTIAVLRRFAKEFQHDEATSFALFLKDINSGNVNLDEIERSNAAHIIFTEDEEEDFYLSGLPNELDCV
jgi:hypothetical protein